MYRPHTFLAIAALTAAFTLSACDGVAEAPGTSSGTAVVAEVVSPRPDLLPGTGNIWLGQLNDVESLLDVVQALSLTGVNTSTASEGITGKRTEVAAEIVEACRRRGLRVFISLNDKVDSLEALSLEEIRDGGAAWGRFARDHEDVVVGISILSEVDNQAIGHELAIGKGTPAGQAAGQAVIERGAEVTHAFAEGVRSEWGGGFVIPGGMAFPTWSAAEDFFRAIAPDVRSGLLDGVALNWYFDAGSFEFVGSQATLRGDALAVRADGLLSAAGLPLDTPIYVTETNVKRSTFANDMEAAWALKALLDQQGNDLRVKAVFPFSPWPSPEKADYYEILPGTPTGSAVTLFARQVRGL